jgi:hypothetical protein
MTNDPTPPTLPTPPAAGANSAYTPKPRMPGGGYWLLLTAAVLLGSLVLAGWANSVPPVFQGPHVNCGYHTDRLAYDAAKFAFLASIVAGLSAFTGLFGAWGWRWWFLTLLPVAPVVMVIAAAANLYTPSGCPGPFS